MALYCHIGFFPSLNKLNDLQRQGISSFFSSHSILEPAKHFLPLSSTRDTLFECTIDQVSLIAHISDGDVRLLRALPRDQSLIWASAHRVEDNRLLQTSTFSNAKQTLNISESSSEFIRGHEDVFAKMLLAPWDAWLVYLHPSQERLVGLETRKPIKVIGAAGTGKTIVAIQRAAARARAGHQVLLTAFNKALCDNIATRVRLLDASVQSMIHVKSLYTVVLDLCVQASKNKPNPTFVVEFRQKVLAAAKIELTTRAPEDAWTEVERVIDAYGFLTFEEYRDHRRDGLGLLLTNAEKEAIWTCYQLARKPAAKAGKYTWGELTARAARHLESGVSKSPYHAVIVDELQDVTPAGVRLLLALEKRGREPLFLCGDAGQRIYVGGMPLSKLGLDTVGTSYSLTINYRTGEQIRKAADELRNGNLLHIVSDDEREAGAVSVMHGAAPAVFHSKTAAEEFERVAEWVSARLAEGIPARAIAVLTAAPESLAKLAKVVDDVAPKIVHNPGEDGVLIANLFKAKGLEFRAVAVTHLNGTHLPKAETLLIADESVRKARVSEERALLYVAMTRARDQLAVFYTGAPSHFLVETGLVE